MDTNYRTENFINNYFNLCPILSIDFEANHICIFIKRSKMRCFWSLKHFINEIRYKSFKFSLFIHQIVWHSAFNDCSCVFLLFVHHFYSNLYNVNVFLNFLCEDAILKNISNESKLEIGWIENLVTKEQNFLNIKLSFFCFYSHPFVKVCLTEEDSKGIHWQADIYWYIFAIRIVFKVYLLWIFFFIVLDWNSVFRIEKRFSFFFIFPLLLFFMHMELMYFVRIQILLILQK